MNPTNRNPAVAVARKAADAAEDVLRKKRGELIAAVRVWADDAASGDDALVDALDRFETAEVAAEGAREDVTAARAMAYSAEEIAERQQAARVSALIARHVMGAQLVATDSKLYPWRIRCDDGGRPREVPNYAGDPTAIALAEAVLEVDTRDAYGWALVNIVGSSPAALATASPSDRALAMLVAIGLAEADPLADAT